MTIYGKGNYRSWEGWGLWAFYTAGGKGLFTWSDMRTQMSSIWTNQKGPFTLIECKICQCKADVFCSTMEIVNNTFVSDIAFTMNDSENQTKFSDSWTMNKPYEGWAFPPQKGRKYRSNISNKWVLKKIVTFSFQSIFFWIETLFVEVI